MHNQVKYQNNNKSNKMEIIIKNKIKMILHLKIKIRGKYKIIHSVNKSSNSKMDKMQVLEME